MGAPTITASGAPTSCASSFNADSYWPITGGSGSQKSSWQMWSLILSNMHMCVFCSQHGEQQQMTHLHTKRPNFLNNKDNNKWKEANIKNADSEEFRPTMWIHKKIVLPKYLLPLTDHMQVCDMHNCSIFYLRSSVYPGKVPCTMKQCCRHLDCCGTIHPTRGIQSVCGIESGILFKSSERICNRYALLTSAMSNIA